MVDDEEIPVNPSLHRLVDGVVDKVLDNHGALSCPSHGCGLIGQPGATYVLYVQAIVVPQDDASQLADHMEKACKEFLDARYGEPVSIIPEIKGGKPN